jgi:hypothetical protein
VRSVHALVLGGVFVISALWAALLVFFPMRALLAFAIIVVLGAGCGVVGEYRQRGKLVGELSSALAVETAKIRMLRAELARARCGDDTLYDALLATVEGREPQPPSDAEVARVGDQAEAWLHGQGAQ